MRSCAPTSVRRGRLRDGVGIFRQASGSPTCTCRGRLRDGVGIFRSTAARLRSVLAHLQHGNEIRVVQLTRFTLQPRLTALGVLQIFGHQLFLVARAVLLRTQPLDIFEQALGFRRRRRLRRLIRLLCGGRRWVMGVFRDFDDLRFFNWLAGISSSILSSSVRASSCGDASILSRLRCRWRLPDLPS